MDGSRVTRVEMRAMKYEVFIGFKSSPAPRKEQVRGKTQAVQMSRDCCVTKAMATSKNQDRWRIQGCRDESVLH